MYSWTYTYIFGRNSIGLAPGSGPVQLLTQWLSGFLSRGKTSEHEDVRSATRPPPPKAEVYHNSSQAFVACRQSFPKYWHHTFLAELEPGNRAATFTQVTLYQPAKTTHIYFCIYQEEHWTCSGHWTCPASYSMPIRIFLPRKRRQEMNLPAQHSHLHPPKQKCTTTHVKTSWHVEKASLHIDILLFLEIEPGNRTANFTQVSFYQPAKSHTHTHTQTHTCTHTCTHAHMHTQMHTHTQMHARAHTRTHMHAHTQVCEQYVSTGHTMESKT